MSQQQIKTTQLNPTAEGIGLSPGWKDWIIENKKFKIPDRTLIETMTQNGFEPQIAMRAVKGIQVQIDRENAIFEIQTNIQTLQKLESLIMSFASTGYKQIGTSS